MVRNNYKCKTCRSNTNADPHQPNETERYQMHLCMACYLKMLKTPILLTQLMQEAKDKADAEAQA